MCHLTEGRVPLLGQSRGACLDPRLTKDRIHPYGCTWRVVATREMVGGSSSYLRILYEAKGCGYARCRVGHILFCLKGWWSLAHPRLCEGPHPSPTFSINVAESQTCHSPRPPAHTLTGAPRLLSRSRGDLRRVIVWSIEVEEVHHGTGVAHHRGMHVRGCGPCGHTHARTYLGQSSISGHRHGSPCLNR